MENSMIAIKNELMEWIENTFDLETLQKVLDLKNQNSALISEINSEKVLENNLDEQFAAGMNSDELLENIAAHLETMASEESPSLVSDVKPEYAVKDDFDKRFAKGLIADKLLQDVFARIETLPWKEK